jgi:hypothetical protein
VVDEMTRQVKAGLSADVYLDFDPRPAADAA